LETCSVVALDAIKIISASNDTKQIDPKGTVEKTLLEAQQHTKKLHQVLIRRRESARADPRLTEDDGVADEFTATISIVGDLHNNLNTLRWTIMEHDADRSKIIGRFDSAEKLTRFLTTKRT
jgi:hypothetical protein